MNKAKALNVLLVSDSLSDINTITEILVNSNFLFNLHTAKDEIMFRSLLHEVSFDIILADFNFPFLSADRTLKLALALQHDVPFICISGLIGEYKAVELMKQGAFDVVTRDSITRLPYAVIRALEEAKIIKQLQRAKNQLRDKKIIKAQNEELRKVNDAKNKFFSIIAHDLKSPLNALLGFSGILIERTKEQKFDDCERIAEIIHQSSIHAIDLLSNLLVWAQAQIGKITFHPEPFNFSDLTLQVIKFIKDAALLKNIDVVNELPPYIPVQADKVMMATVMRNLLTNAVKFTHPGGKVTVACMPSAGELSVSVHDTGVGIPQDKINKLFLIENTYSTYGTSKESGTGLGLILCREFISKHKGKIWAESKTAGNPEGISGSTFHFSIPNLISV